ncbi:homoaconitate hydratase [Pelomyxa schiedti]|nr:homoaconitate hydratase [Pelomyxa schiedti]
MIAQLNLLLVLCSSLLVRSCCQKLQSGPAPDWVGFGVSLTPAKGVAWSQQHNFLVGTTQGEVITVDDSGNPATFLDDSHLGTVLGIVTVESLNLLYLCTVQNLSEELGNSGVLLVALDSGDSLNYLPLATNESAYPSDITVDEITGTAFVVDSSLAIIYRITNGKTVEAWITTPEIRSVTGITLANNGSILLAVSEKGYLLALDTTEKTPTISNCKLSQALNEARDISVDTHTNEEVIVAAKDKIFRVTAPPDGWLSEGLFQVSQCDPKLSLPIRACTLRNGSLELFHDSSSKNQNYFYFEKYAEGFEQETPELITANRNGISPEGIEWSDVQQGFFLSSTTDGSIYLADDSGLVQQFVPQSTTGIASVGIHTDNMQGIVVYGFHNASIFSGPVVGFECGINILDIVSRNVIQTVDLSFFPDTTSRHLINDVTTDSLGNIYGTDSFGNLVWKVSQWRDGLSVSVSATFAIIVNSSVCSSLGLNGIAQIPHSNNLLVGSCTSGQLFLLYTESSNYTEVTLSEPIWGTDGLVVCPSGACAYSTSASWMYYIETSDTWLSATVTKYSSQFSTEYGTTTATLRYGEPYALHSKIVLRHTNLAQRPSPGDYVTLRVDVRAARDVGGPGIIKRLRKKGLSIEEADKTCMMLDCYPLGAESHHECREFAQERGMRLLDVDQGIGSHVLIRRGIVGPGGVFACTDSHANIVGAVGALGLGMGEVDIAHLFATGETWFKVPPSVKLELTGTLPETSTPKDVALALLQTFHCDTFLGASMELVGSYTESLDLAGRITICSLATELGVLAILIQPTEEILRATSCNSIGHHDLQPDDDAQYSQVLTFDISHVQPLVSLPGNPENVVTVKEILGTKIDSCLIGSCTNSSIEDLRVVAKILSGRPVATGVILKIVPATRGDYVQALEEGLMKIFLDSGAIVANPGCAGCAAGQVGQTGVGEVSLSSGNRNFPGKQGGGQVFLASPATIAASALMGHITTTDFL